MTRYRYTVYPEHGRTGRLRRGTVEAETRARAEILVARTLNVALWRVQAKPLDDVPADPFEGLTP